jgi:nicotinamide-nucleotide amidase
VKAEAARVLNHLRRARLTLATAESCTGGMLAAALTDPAGASDVLRGCIVAYSNEAKVALLDVLRATLEADGAVSEAVAREMARGAATRFGADVAVAITGIAGPGASERKPEGRVCFAIKGPEGTARSETVEFGAMGRARVRSAAAEHALRLLLTMTDRP